MKPLTTYKITIDPEYAEGEEDLGIDQIAFTATPAIKVKGMAFSTQAPAQRQHFADGAKMRIAAPALIPMEVYRNDAWGEYYVEFTEAEIEKIHAKFMQNLTNKNKFNLEHDEKKLAPAYVLEAWLIENPLEDKAYSSFGMELPKGTLFVVAQITDQKYYDDLVQNGRTGFSIEGFLGLKLNEHRMTKKQKLQKIMKNQKLQSFKDMPRFAGLYLSEDGQLAESGQLTIVAASLTPDTDAVVIGRDLEVITDYTGDILVGEKLVALEGGRIVEVVSGEAELEETIKEEKMGAYPKEEEMGLEVGAGAKVGANPSEEEKLEEEKKEEEKMEEVVEEKIEEEIKMQIDEAELMTILQPKFEEIYGLIAEVKVAVDALVREETTEEEIEVAPLPVAQKLSAALNFLSK